MKRRRNNLPQQIIAIALSLVIVFGYNYIKPKSIDTKIALQFEGVEKGLNPDGTRFDYNELVTRAVISSVTKTAGFEYKDEWIDNISVKPVLPGNIVDFIKSKRVAGENYTYYPNEFIITVFPDASEELDQTTALAIADSYKSGFESYFIDKYQYPFMNLNQMLGYFDYNQYDYPEITNVYENEFNMILSYLSVLITDDPEFVSAKGYTFSDIKETIEISKDLDLNQINAVVSSYRLTKDIDKLILKYEYMIKRSILDKNKKESQFAVSDALITVIEDNASSFVVPGIGGDGITITTLDSSYDSIVEQATDTKLESATIQEEILYLQKQIDDLITDSVQIERRQEAEFEVERLVQNLNEKIDRWISLIEESAKEYFDHKYEGSISLVQKAQISGNLSIKMMIASILSLAIGIFTILMIIKRKLYNSKKTSEA